MLLGCCLRRREHLACFQTPTEQACFPQLWRICSKSFILRGRKGQISRRSGWSSLSTDCKSRHSGRQNFILVSCLLSILCSGSSGMKLFRSSTCPIRALSPSLFVFHPFSSSPHYHKPFKLQNHLAPPMLPPLRPSVTRVRATTTPSAPDPISGSPSPGVERRPSLLPPLRPLCPPATRVLSAITTAAAGPGPFTGPPSPGLASLRPGVAQSNTITRAAPAPGPVVGPPSPGLASPSPGLASPRPGHASSELPPPPPSGAPSGPPPSGPAPPGPAPTCPPPSDAPVPTAVAKRQDSSELPPPPPPSGVPSGPHPSGPAPTGPLPSDAPRPGFASPRPGVAQSTTITTRAAAGPGPVVGPPSPGIAQSTTTTTRAAAPGPVPGPPSTGHTQSANGLVHDPNRPHWRDLPPDWRDPVTGVSCLIHSKSAHV